MSQIDGLTKQTTSLKLLCTQDPRDLMSQIDGLTKQNHFTETSMYTGPT